MCLREARTQGLGVTQEWGVEEQRCEHKRRDTTEKMARSQGPMKTLDATGNDFRNRDIHYFN